MAVLGLSCSPGPALVTGRGHPLGGQLYKKRSDVQWSSVVADTFSDENAGNAATHMCDDVCEKICHVSFYLHF